MDTSTIIEAVGYLGSTLVLVSFLMSSVLRLRLVNTAGSLIFAIYALIIRSCPFSRARRFAIIGQNIGKEALL